MQQFWSMSKVYACDTGLFIKDFLSEISALYLAHGATVTLNRLTLERNAQHARSAQTFDLAGAIAINDSAVPGRNYPR